MENVKKENNFGSWLREARLARALTQGELALQLGVSLKSITNWELGETPSPQKKRKILEFFTARGTAPMELRESSPKYRTTNQTEESSEEIPSRDQCRERFERFLATCETPHHFGWTLMEIQENFPLNKWKNPKHE